MDAFAARRHPVAAATREEPLVEAGKHLTALHRDRLTRTTDLFRGRGAVQLGSPATTMPCS